jgi:hypothetical protein
LVLFPFPIIFAAEFKQFGRFIIASRRLGARDGEKEAAGTTNTLVKSTPILGSLVSGVGVVTGKDPLDVTGSTPVNRAEEATGLAVGAAVGATAEKLAPVITRAGGEIITSLMTKTDDVAIDVAESRMTTVIGSMDDVARFKGQPGYNVLERPAGMSDAAFGRYNAEWMNTSLRRGDTIMAVTDPAAHRAMLEGIRPGLSGKSNYLQIELPMLEHFGATVPSKVSVPPVVPFYLTR